MDNKRVILIAIAVAVAFICLGVLGVRTYVQAIYDTRSCDWANIDNIEMHARIDIPKVENCDCSYTVSDNMKRAVFILEKSEDLNSFIEQQKLKAMQQPEDRIASVGSFDKNTLYVREGNHQDSRYRLALDPASRKLWVQITYKR